ncbi:MAG: hypothetical protein KGZ58_02535, partial [Ignavibacteriales bacterium]|nr:hypothetical protein [Ignavibacteriales bacterium]
MLFFSPLISQNEKFSEEWRWIQFTTSSGLPSNNIQNILETKDGVVWVNTSEGIAYFDNYQWIPIDSTKGLPPGFPSVMNEGDENSILVAINGKLYHGNQKGFQLLSQGVLNAVNFSKNTILIHSRYSLFLFENGSSHPFTPQENVTKGKTQNLYRTKSGNIWINTLSGLYLWKDDRWHKKFSTNEVSVYLNSLIEDGNGAGLASISAPVNIRGLWEWNLSTQPQRNTSEQGEY